jgi:hypothetical protein
VVLLRGVEKTSDRKKVRLRISIGEKKRSAKKRSGNTTPPPRLAAKHFSGEVGPKEVFFEKWEYDTQP